MDGNPAWIIGSVEEGDRTVKISDKARIIEVPIQDALSGLW